MPDSCAARRASAAFFLLTNAAPEDAFAIRIRARRAFCNQQDKTHTNARVKRLRATRACDITLCALRLSARWF